VEFVDEIPVFLFEISSAAICLVTEPTEAMSGALCNKAELFPRLSEVMVTTSYKITAVCMIRSEAS
jgi:hypothetical protein